MKFTETKIKGVYLIDIEPRWDDRGFFARTVCVNEFTGRGIKSSFVQCSISYNRKKGTLRGMHYQGAPHEEAKLVRCTRGAIYDVILDLRPLSSTFLQWVAVESTHENGRAVYVPEGCAHGFQTLTDDADVFYQMTEFFYPECSMGVRWNDPRFGIEWPAIKPRVISERDRSYPDFKS